MAKSEIEDIDRQIRELNLKLIKLNEKIERAKSKGDFVRRIEDPEFQSLSTLQMERRTIEAQIKYLENERAKLTSPAVPGSDDKQSKHDRVVAEVDKRRQANPDLSKEEIFRQIADDWNETFDAIKRAYYYQPKK